MTLGLCLLAIAQATSPSIPQGKGGKQASQKEKTQTPKPRAEKATPKVVAAPQLFRDVGLSLAKRVDELYSALTPEERTEFLCVHQKAIDRLGIPAFEWSDRARDPMFPDPIGLAASFDLDLASRVATEKARQADARARVHFVSINVVTDPRWGEAGDTFGEDPMLVGWMAHTFVSGLHRGGVIPEAGVLGRLGRTADIPGQIGIALPSGSLVSAFLDPAAFAITGDPGMGFWIDPLAHVVSGPLFDAKFLGGTVRKEWGLKGPIIAGAITPNAVGGSPTAVDGKQDSGSVKVPVGDTGVSGSAVGNGSSGGGGTADGGPPPSAKGSGSAGGSPPLLGKGSGTADGGPPVLGKGQAAAHPGAQEVKPAAHAAPQSNFPVDALLNGCDLFSAEDVKAIVEAAKSRSEVSKAIELAIRTVLISEMGAGLFDPKSDKNPGNHPADETAQIQARAARESIVLLKNDGNLLPLKKGIKTVAVIGPSADSVSSLLGSDEAPSGKVLTPLAAIRAALGEKTKVLYEKGTGLFGREDLQTIPASAFADGLAAEYFDKPDLSGTPMTDKADHLDLSWKGPPIEGITSKNFSASWTGVIRPTVSGTYGIGFTVDGGARLFVDDVLVLDDWKDGPTRTKTVPIDLPADDNQFYVVRVEYLHGTGDGSLRLVWSPPEKEPFRAAVEAAIKADLVILVLGLGPSLENASTDRREIGLPDSQEGLLEQIVAIPRPTVLILLNGGPVSTPVAKKEIPAILEAWYPGEAGGTAIADALTGAFSPSGKMPITVYQGVSQLPDPANVDAPRGYLYSLYRPLFPFGSGLSYTNFSYSNLNVPMVFDQLKPMIVGVTVKNSGKIAGDEITEMYITHGKPSTSMPRIALKGFRRIHLNVGESRRIVFTLTQTDLAVVHADGSRWLEPEPITVSMGGNQPMDSQPETLSAVFRIRGPGPVKLQD
jgi:beta-glucosidase-like glycosyl hydrolase